MERKWEGKGKKVKKEEHQRIKEEEKETKHERITFKLCIKLYKRLKQRRGEKSEGKGPSWF